MAGDDDPGVNSPIMDPATPLPFHLDVTNPAKVKCLVDGVDVVERYRVKRVGFEVGVGIPPRLFIELLHGGVLEGEAVIHQIGEERDQRESVLAFLSNIDPRILESAALVRGGMLEGNGEETMGQSFLAALQEMLGDGH